MTETQVDKAFADHIARLAAMTFPNALRVGDSAPDFELPNASGDMVRLSSLLERGPVVLVFYRGAWCPYCNAQLHELQARLPEIASLGATLVAISPQLPDASSAFANDAGLGFEVLSDVGSYLASDYAITFEFSEIDRNLFLSVGNDLSRVYGSEAWVVPAPSTYVIRQDATIEYAHISPNYTERPDVDEMLDALRGV
jgi:peroxiredoxin